MPTLDYASEIYEAVWGALFGSESTTVALAVKLNCRLRDDRFPRQTETRHRVPNDWPRAKLTIPNLPQNILDNAPRVFGQNSVSYTPSTVNFSVPATVVLNLEITYDRITADTDVVEVLARSVLMAKWPKLGLAYVLGFTLSERRTKKKTEPDDALRTVVEMTITVNARPMISQLV